MVHRDLWQACGGYDERMIYMNDMESNMIARLIINHPMINLGKLVDYDFYHLEHYNPLALRSASAYRKVNPHEPFSNPDMLNPNGPEWGLIRYPLEKMPYGFEARKVKTTTSRQIPFEWFPFMLLVMFTGMQIARDKIFKYVRTMFFVWSHRAREAWDAVRGESLFHWPRLLAGFWKRKIHDHGHS